MIFSKVKAGAAGAGVGGAAGVGLAGVLAGILDAVLKTQGVDLGPGMLGLITALIGAALASLGSFAAGYAKKEMVGLK